MKYLHVMPPSQRMMRGYLLMLRKYFKTDDHVILFNSKASGADVGLLLFENTIDFPKTEKGRVKKYISKIKKYILYKQLFSKAEHIVFHQFSPNISLLVLLFFHREWLKKSIWVIWGIDLYNYKYRSKKIKARILNYLGTTCRKCIEIPVVLLPTDIAVYHEEFGDRPVLCAPYDTADDIWAHLDQLMQKEYERKDCQQDDGELPQNEKGKTTEEIDLQKNLEKTQPIKILVGHNAHIFNRHRDILNLLERFNQEDILLYLPLSYGNDGAEHIENYPRMIEEYAKILFPNKVVPMKKLVSKWEYDKLLSSIDIAILGAPRQNAVGNIIRLLYMGKKVYLASDNPLYAFLIEKGFHIYDIKELEHISYEEFITQPPQEGPNPWLKGYYGTTSAAGLWQQVFDYAEGKITYDEIKIP